ncbi:hypothetical protein ABH935_002019 [Catenulispora sp. GAS73]
MTSLGGQFGCAPHVALAAAGFRGHDHAAVQVSAVVRWRLAVFVSTIARRSESLRMS